MLSIVIPYFNEAKAISAVLSRTQAVMVKLSISDYEVLIVNNGSSPEDSSFLEQISKKYPQTRILVLSRNFGYQGALWAGLDRAKGNTVVFMDGDGEDPPELIEKFIENWKKGFDVVYGIRRTRKVSFLMGLSYRLFYRLLAKFSNIQIPLDAGEFSLISGRALSALREFRDRTRMMRVLRAWIGFRQVGIPYDREARIAGKSKFNILSAFSFAWDGFLSATDIPVNMSIYCSAACFVAGIVGSAYYFFWYFFAQVKIPGFASLNITLLLLFSMLFLCVGVLSRYVITLLDEARGRPPYLVDSEISSKQNDVVLNEQKKST